MNEVERVNSMELKDYKKEISYLLRNNNGRLIDISYKAIEIIMQSGNVAPVLLRYFFEEEYAVTKFKDTKEAPIVTDKELDSYIDKYAIEVWSWLNDVLENKPATTAFYNSLYDFLCKNKKIRSKKIRAFFFLSVWIDHRIPYYKPENGKALNRDEFIKISKKITKSRAKAKTVVFSKYSTRTEEASVLIGILDGLSSKEEKAVLLSSIIKSVEVRTEDSLYKKTAEKETDNT